MASSIVTGAKVIVYVNGSPLGRVTSFSYNVSTIKSEIRGVDSIIPFELAPQAVITSGQMTVIGFLSDSGAEGLGLSTPIPNLPAARYFDLKLFEIPTGNIIFASSQTALDNQSWSYNAKGVVMGGFSFKCIDYGNLMQPAPF